MALQSSGTISLNDAHVEVGGSSGSTVALNDADIRGLIGKASGAQFALSELYGASSVVGWIYVTVTPLVQSNNSGNNSFSSIAINSSNDYFVVNEMTAKTNRTSGTPSMSNLELWKMTNEGVVSTRKGFSLDHISSTKNPNTIPTQRGSIQKNPSMNKIFLRGTSDIYLVNLRNLFYLRYYNASYWQPIDGYFLSKYNQSNCEQEDKRWHHNYANAQNQQNFGSIESITGYGTTGWPSPGFHSATFVDSSNKVNVQQSYRFAGGDMNLFCARYPLDSSYNQAPEMVHRIRMNSNSSGKWNPIESTPTFACTSGSSIWRMFTDTNGGSYGLVKDTQRSYSATSNGYTTQSNNSGISYRTIKRLNTESHPTFMCSDGNGNPAVFGYGGAPANTGGTVNDYSIWCQKHTSTGAKGNRFQFNGSNSGSSYGEGGFQTAVFDSSDNCYMSGWSAMRQNADGIWSRRGSQWYTFPRIGWIAKFNSSGVYQWHKWFDVKEYNQHFVGGGSSSDFTSTYEVSDAYEQYVRISNMAIDTEGYLVVTGSSIFYGGNTSRYKAGFVMKLPADGAVNNGDVGVSATVNGGTRHVGIRIGTFGGDGRSSSSQFYQANQSLTPIFSNTDYEENSPTVGITHANPRTGVNVNGSSYNTTSLPCAFNIGGGFHGGAFIGRSQQDNHGHFLPYTPPTEYTGTGKGDF